MPGSPHRLLRSIGRLAHAQRINAGVLIGFVALAVAMTWPLARHLATHVVRAKWYYDSMVNIHILGSRMHYALGMSQSLKSVYDNYFCAPTPYSIANNENHFGLALLYAPFYLMTRDPLLAYNLLLLLCIALSGFCMFVFVRELTGHPLAAVLSGVAYAFSPYVFFELGRIQLVAAQWIPLFALFLHRAARSGRLADLIALGLTFAMQVGCCLYYAVFLGVYGAFVGAGCLWRSRPACARSRCGWAWPPDHRAAGRARWSIRTSRRVKTSRSRAVKTWPRVRRQAAGLPQGLSREQDADVPAQRSAGAARADRVPGLHAAAAGGGRASLVPIIATLRREDRGEPAHSPAEPRARPAPAGARGLAEPGAAQPRAGAGDRAIGAAVWRARRPARLLPPLTFLYASCCS